RPAENLPSAANPLGVELRTDPAIRGGTFAYEGPDVVTGWHVHELHQVEYALAGVVEVETPAAHYLLPPQQAIWVPAGLPHNTILRGVRSVSVFFDPAMVPGAAARARILAAAPVIREMLEYGTRWPIGRDASDATADAFFDALALLTVEWLEHELPLCLPASDDPTIAAAMTYTNTHLATVTVGEVAAAVGWSERSLRRRFAAGAGMPWSAYARQSRLLAATAMLAADRS